MLNSNWSWSIPTPDGWVREYRLAFDGSHFDWWEQADPDPENRDPGLSVHQELGDFRDHGPPDHPAFASAPTDVLQRAYGTVGSLEGAPWLQPLSEDLKSWLAAADQGDISTLERLLVAGMDVNATDHQLRSALSICCYGRDTRTTRWLLDHGAEVNQLSRCGGTVLMTAALLRDRPRMMLYLAHGADLQLRNSEGKTACHIAIESRAPLGMIMDLCPRDHNDHAALMHLAARASHVPALGWLSHTFPDVNQPGPGKFGWRPLQACFHHSAFHPAAARLLLEAGARLDFIDPMDGATSLHRATSANLPWLVPLCISAGVNVDARNAQGESALSLAVTGMEKPRLVQALLKADASPTLLVAPAPQPGGNSLPESESVLQRAAREGHIWSHWLMTPRTGGISWSGLCCHAHLRPKSVLPSDTADDNRRPGECWLEFPAEWTSQDTAALQKRLNLALHAISTSEGFAVPSSVMEAVPLSRAEAMKQPWEWPGRELWAVFPDHSVQRIATLRQRRPESMMADPSTFSPQGIKAEGFRFEWKSASLEGVEETAAVVLRQSLLTWTVANCETIQSLEEFRLEGPPRGLNMDESIPQDLLDSLCALIGETQRCWDAPHVAEGNRSKAASLRKARETARQAALDQPVPDPPPANAARVYARLDIKDRFTTASGAPGAETPWQCWMEFPESWLSSPAPHLQHWLTTALQKAYAAMNERTASDPEGGVTHLLKCEAVPLTAQEARLQPWARGNRVLYLVNDLTTTPEVASGKARFRNVEPS